MTKAIFTLIAGICLMLAACAAADPVLIDATTPPPSTVRQVSAEPGTGPEIVVIAHRCNGGPYTENTIDQCVAAVADGATFIEGDIQVTSTGTLVSLHDDHLGVFGAPSVKINSLSFTAASEYVSDEHNNLTLITQNRDLVQAMGLRWLLEWKATPSSADWIALDSRLKPVKSQVIISSFDKAVVTQAIARGYTAALNTYADVTSPPAGTKYIAQRASDIDAATVSTLRGKNIDVYCFSCNDATSWASMKSKGVVGFITDDHFNAQHWVETH